MASHNSHLVYFVHFCSEASQLGPWAMNCVLSVCLLVRGLWYAYGLPCSNKGSSTLHGCFFCESGLGLGICCGTLLSMIAYMIIPTAICEVPWH